MLFQRLNFLRTKDISADLSSIVVIVLMNLLILQLDFVSTRFPRRKLQETLAVMTEYSKVNLELNSS